VGGGVGGREGWAHGRTGGEGWEEGRGGKRGGDERRYGVEYNDVTMKDFLLTLSTICLDPVILRVLWSLATVLAASAASVCGGGNECVGGRQDEWWGGCVLVISQYLSCVI